MGTGDDPTQPDNLPLGAAAGSFKRHDGHTMKDPLLELIVNAALIVGAKSEGRFPAYITVSVGGILVAGEIISGAEFIKGRI